MKHTFCRHPHSQPEPLLLLLQCEHSEDRCSVLDMLFVGATQVEVGVEHRAWAMETHASTHSLWLPSMVTTHNGSGAFCGLPCSLVAITSTHNSCLVSIAKWVVISCITIFNRSLTRTISLRVLWTTRYVSEPTLGAQLTWSCQLKHTMHEACY